MHGDLMSEHVYRCRIDSGGSQVGMKHKSWVSMWVAALSSSHP